MLLVVFFLSATKLPTTSVLLTSGSGGSGLVERAQLTKALCNEWAPHGINVNAIAPGYVKTNLNPHVWGDPVRSAEIVSRLPCGRWAEPEDMAGPAVFLASPASDYLHGVILPVDGGFMAR